MYTHNRQKKEQSRHGTGEQKMANEKRLIDANALKEKAIPDYESGEMLLYGSMVDEAPTVDAVEVVLCKKCLYSSQYADENGMYKCGGILTEDGDCFLMVKPDHFCAFGERRGKKMDGERKDNDI
jgi:hypothetical protein